MSPDDNDSPLATLRRRAERRADIAEEWKRLKRHDDTRPETSDSTPQ